MNDPLNPQPKAFDIFSPRKFQPSATARPVIVSNKPEQPDPMMKSNAPGSDIVDDPALMPVPLNETPEAVMEQVAERIEELQEKPTEQSSNPQASQLVTEPAGQSGGMAYGAGSFMTGSAPAPKEQAAATSEAQPPSGPTEADAQELEKQEQDDGQWSTHPPVVSFHHHKGLAYKVLKWTLVILVSLALAALVLNVLLDAGTITTNYDIPHTNFIPEG